MMTSVPKLAKTLSKGEQNKSIKGGKKQKKSVIKNTLENPFALSWPDINSEREKEVKELLMKSCSGLKKVHCKPPWKEVQQYKGEERKVFLEEYRRKFQEKLSPESTKQAKEVDEALSHVILGYNAVMRALEQDRISGIMVKKNVQPSFVVKTFLPGCANKCIPLFPLTDLDSLLKNKDTLGLPHACMVFGLKPSVREETNRFHALYVKMCEAVEIDADRDSYESEEESTEENEGKSVKKNDQHKSYHRLSEQEIKKYHLKRTHTAKRAFVPTKEKVDSTMDTFGSDFIKFGEDDAEPSLNLEREQLVERKVIKSTTEATESEAITQPPKEGSDSKEEKSFQKIKSQKKKRAKFESDEYVPAKTKRLKGNPNRKTKA